MCGCCKSAENKSKVKKRNSKSSGVSSVPRRSRARNVPVRPRRRLRQQSISGLSRVELQKVLKLRMQQHKYREELRKFVLIKSAFNYVINQW